ncbi:MAG: hypothetical protein QI199_05885 [Candidatus Korarchaeota archaeon]|nr:hypothetical protein [Candidatus Korarchaeota archaeon]
MLASRALGTIIGMIIFAALMVSALGLMIYTMYSLQTVNTMLSDHNARVAQATQAAGSVCYSWIYSPASGLVEVNMSNNSPRPARLVGIVLLYGPSSFAASNESLVIPPGDSRSIELRSSRKPVSLVLALLIDDVVVRSTCRRG